MDRIGVWIELPKDHNRLAFKGLGLTRSIELV